MKSATMKAAIAIALVLLLCVYFWNPFDAPTWSPIGRFAGRQYFKTPGEGMQPTFAPGSNVLICFGTFKNQHPKVNDIVMFRVPGEERMLFLKRVVAVAGSTVEIRDSVLLVDGDVVTSPFWQAGEHSSPYSTTLAPTRAPPDSFYSLGDNLEQSLDSRRIGPVPFRNVVGGLCAQQAVAADRPKTGSG